MPTMSWTNGRGKLVTREINWTLDIRDRQDDPGFALLVIACNTHLSVSDLRQLLGTEGIERSTGWIQRRRWLFQEPGTVNSQGKPNADGKDERAIDFMLDNPKSSIRQLVRLLSEKGITRSRDWVRRNRC